MEWKANWICPPQPMGDVCPVYEKRFSLPSPVQKAVLLITAMGTYEAVLNGERVSGYVLAPGFTSYLKRHQVQEYDITAMLGAENTLRVTVGRGWYRSPMPGWLTPEEKSEKQNTPAGLTAQVVLTLCDGSERTLCTDTSWGVAESPIRFSEIYDGEVYDARVIPSQFVPAQLLEHPTDCLIPQEGEEIREQERMKPLRVFTTPKGETVVDFGQEIAGYVEITLDAKAGDLVELSHGEVLDKEGNFYNENYRAAKAKLTYICRDGRQTYKPRLTFYGFRFVRVDAFPGQVHPSAFTAIVVHSQMKRTGDFSCSNPLLNQLFSNVIWSQKGNFLDIPTDCPQRDERLGWTGDAQVFIKTASYNYDVQRFFRKWLKDLAADQWENGAVSHVNPAWGAEGAGSSVWGDAAVICPWQLYLTYADKEVLQSQYESMTRYLGFIAGSTKEPDLWIGGFHYGDWLGLDADDREHPQVITPEMLSLGDNAEFYKGASRDDLIASAFYAYSTQLVIKIGKILGRDTGEYEASYQRIRRAFQEKFPEYYTQTEYVMAAYFGLAKDCQKAADDLAEMIIRDGTKLRTGFVGTAYVLHTLSRYGHTDLAYSLLLRQEYPSWLYPVTKGATTIWEHWDGIKPDGSFWSSDMNSFNHYAYGAVADWLYGVVTGINTVEEAPGFEKVLIAPQPDSRLQWAQASIQTRKGLVRSAWRQTQDGIRYEITVPSPAQIVIDGQTHSVTPGEYIFYSENRG